MHALSGRKAKRARRRAPGRALSVPPGVIEVTEAGTGTAHLVPKEVMAAGGRYVTLCGREVRLASPTAFQSRSCACCVAWFLAWRYRLVELRSSAG